MVMFKLNEIRELIKLLDETTIVELQMESEGTKITIRKSEAITGRASSESAPLPAQPLAPPAPATAVSAPAVEPGKLDTSAESLKSPVAEDVHLHTITSPMVGTFYRAPAPDAPPYVQIGSKVAENTVVCIVEAMKLMNEIEADVRGEIVDILAENGQLVEYGQPLFLVRVE
jgi:acetyl-CoA carboxylase biotin carboxyl carrier protein